MKASNKKIRFDALFTEPGVFMVSVNTLKAMRVESRNFANRTGVFFAESRYLALCEILKRIPKGDDWISGARLRGLVNLYTRWYNHFNDPTNVKAPGKRLDPNARDRIGSTLALRIARRLPKPSHRVLIYRDHIGEWRWTLFARNGNKVADSAEGYMRRGACERAIDTILSLSPGNVGRSIVDVKQKKEKNGR